MSIVRNPAFWLLAASIVAIAVGASTSPAVTAWAYRVLETGPEPAPFVAELRGPGAPEWYRMPDNYFTREDAETAAQIYIRQQEREQG